MTVLLKRQSEQLNILLFSNTARLGQIKDFVTSTSPKNLHNVQGEGLTSEGCRFSLPVIQ